MKKILIICDLFPPAFGPRMGYLCKYLKQYGWEPIVLTESSNDNTFAFLADLCETTYINFYPSPKNIIRKLQWFIIFSIRFAFVMSMLSIFFSMLYQLCASKLISILLFILVLLMEAVCY